MRAIAFTALVVPSLVAAAPSLALAQVAQTRAEPPPPIVEDIERPGALRARPPAEFATTPVPVAAVPAVPVSQQGEWVFTEERGYVWVPKDSVARVVLGLPAVHLYTPEAGWGWYASPWGEGPARTDGWVSRPWSQGFRTLAVTSAGLTWSARAPRAPANAAYFGSQGHFYDASGAFVAERSSSTGARSGRTSSSHASRTGGSTREPGGGRTSHH